MIDIEFKEVCKHYNKGHQVINNLSLQIEQGEFVTLLGPSGCGKTTLLKMVNKLIKPDDGHIWVKGTSIHDWHTTALRRGIGYVIQQIGLFPHMRIKDNISYVPMINNMTKSFREKRARELVHLVGLEEDMLERYPRELSGGQKQRIGVARALAADPDIILMDEPFGAVDEIARTKLQEQLKHIHQQLGKTILFVTHDISEALKLGTRIVLMHNGQIEQSGTKEELIFQPKTPFVKDFLGLKGFKAALNEGIMEQIYGDILTGDTSMQAFYDQINTRIS